MFFPGIFELLAAQHVQIPADVRPRTMWSYDIVDKTQSACHEGIGKLFAVFAGSGLDSF